MHGGVKHTLIGAGLRVFQCAWSNHNDLTKPSDNMKHRGVLYPLHQGLIQLFIQLLQGLKGHFELELDLPFSGGTLSPPRCLAPIFDRGNQLDGE